jgi:hypothetical protein
MPETADHDGRYTHPATLIVADHSFHDKSISGVAPGRMSTHHHCLLKLGSRENILDLLATGTVYMNRLQVLCR